MTREEVLQFIWEAQDEAYDLMAEYDSLPHYYGENVLYQAEAYIVNQIGENPDITSTELAANLKKTPSACSQIVKKLISKGLVEQNRNMQNKRIYNLRLTESGERLYTVHVEFNKNCQRTMFQKLEDFSDEELQTYLKIQKCINRNYQNDVSLSRERFGAESE